MSKKYITGADVLRALADGKRLRRAWQLPSIVWVRDMCRACVVPAPQFWTRVYSEYWGAQSSSATESNQGLMT